MRPKKPAAPKEAATPDQLRAWFKELKKYEAALKKWDETLTEREEEVHQYIENNSGNLEEYADLIGEELWFCNVCEVEHVGPVDTFMGCYSEWSRRRNRGEWTPEINGNPCAEIAIETVQGTKAEIDWLEALYKLPDRRRKKK